MDECGCKMEEEVKAMKSEIKRNKPGFKSLIGTKERNKHSTRTK